MPNHYLRATHSTDHADQLTAFRRFAEEEMHRTHERLTALEADDGSIPDANREEWAQRKGELDTLRLFHGMFVQALLTIDPPAIEPDPEGGRE